jgi:periplasmic copper chaperone A
MVRRLVVSAALALLALAVAGSPASAHIDPDPKEAQAGSRLTVGFTVEHGCDGSPTVRLDMRLPAGVVDPVAEPVDGWTGSVATTTDGTIVSFVGGPLADDVEGTFGVTMTLPPTPDTTIYFPFVQRCEAGEIRWIGIPAEPGDDLDEPAPAMILIGPVATTVPTTTPPVTTPASTESNSAPPTTEPAPTTTAAASETTSPDTTDPVLVAAGDGSSGGSNTGTIAFVLTLAVMLVLGVTVAYRARQSRAAFKADATGAGTGVAPGDAG